MDPQMRVSDADREHVVAELQRQVAEGRLSLDEFSERSARAYSARTRGDLVAVTADLPQDDESRRAPEQAGRWRVHLTLAVVLVGFLLLGGLVTMGAAGGAMMGGMCP